MTFGAAVDDLKTQAPQLFSGTRLGLNKLRSQNKPISPLTRQIESRLLDRLNDVKRSYEKILVIGPHSPQFIDDLKALTKGAEIEISSQSVFEKIDFPYKSFDLVFSLRTLHWTNDVPGFLRQCLFLLKPDGLFLAACFGGDSLKEFSQSLIEAESKVRGSMAMRICPFLQPNQAAHLMQRAGFALPVCDIDRQVLQYGSVDRLIKDLRDSGEGLALTETPPSLNKDIYKHMKSIYESKFSNPEDGFINVTAHTFYLTGWAPHPRQQQALKRGSATVSLVDLTQQP